MSEDFITMTIGKQKNIALIAHDNKKADLIDWIPPYHFSNALYHILDVYKRQVSMCRSAARTIQSRDGERILTWDTSRRRPGS